MYNVIHPSFKHGKHFEIGNFCHILENCEVGDNVTVRDYVRLGKGTKIGNNVYLDSYVRSSGENRIGNNVVLRYGAEIARQVTVEDDVFISGNVATIFQTHQKKVGEPVKKSAFISKAGTVIGKGSFIGMNVVIGPGLKVGPKVVIGALAMVTKDCTIPGVYIGIPAKLVRKF
ncbi:dTDP-3-amino-3,6-dideoxy-alpha-D-galactopyranose 3-N-acetyltransferase [subsurface metagenome]